MKHLPISQLWSAKEQHPSKAGGIIIIKPILQIEEPRRQRLRNLSKNTQL